MLIANCAYLFLFVFSSTTFASILPHQYKLIQTSPDFISMDAALAKWFEDHKEADSPNQAIKDPILKNYVLIHQGKNKDIKYFQEMLTLLNHYKKEKGTEHPLAPYIYKEFFKTQERAVALNMSTEEALLQNNILSCPSISHIEDTIEEPQFWSGPKESPNKWLNYIAKVPSIKAQQNLWKSTLDSVPEDKRKTYAKRFTDFLKPFPDLSLVTEWLATQDVEMKAEDIAVSIRRLARRDLCVEAKSLFGKNVNQSSKNRTITEFHGLLDSLEGCFKKKGKKSALNLWQEFSKDLETYFGVEGYAYAQLKMAKILWNADDYDGAKAILKTVISRGEQTKKPKVVGDAYFILAQIDENEELYQEAKLEYLYFIKNFSNHEKFYEALKSLVLIYAGASDWDNTFEYASKITEGQNDLPLEARQPNIDGFGLFWAARAKMELHEVDAGLGYLERLASEYYSTYYGALAHYTTELFYNKKLNVVPIQKQNFNLESLENSYEGQEKVVFLRSQLLLELGMPKEAICEAKLLTEGDNPQKTVAKALLLHSGGEWLSAIKLYSNLPRSYRQTLPLGMERILFPRRYENSIKHYSELIGMDPDFVLSLIRQESVFNPEASSLAGAKGLMQLMNRTAKIVAKSLNPQQFPKQVKQELISKVQKEEELYDVDTNLIIGTNYLSSLLKKYNNTVTTLSAFNAGPSATERWIKKYSTNDMLYFIERIPYNETRDYVKLIIRNYFYYKKWYITEPTGAPKILPHLQLLTGQLLNLKTEWNQGA